jgi:hypothetical protein
MLKDPVMVVGIRLMVSHATSPALALIIGVPAGALIYAATSFALKSAELRDCLALTR